MIHIDTQHIKWVLSSLISIVCLLIIYCTYTFSIDIRTIQQQDALYHQKTQSINLNTATVLPPNVVIQWNLFGSNKTANIAHKYTVIGIFMDNNPRLRAAVISKDNAAPKLYYTGDKLIGSDSIKAIFADRVIIQSGTQSDTIYYSGITAGQTTADSELDARLKSFGLDQQTIKRIRDYRNSQLLLQQQQQQRK